MGEEAALDHRVPVIQGQQGLSHVVLILDILLIIAFMDGSFSLYYDPSGTDLSFSRDGEASASLRRRVGW